VIRGRRVLRRDPDRRTRIWTPVDLPDPPYLWVQARSLVTLVLQGSVPADVFAAWTPVNVTPTAAGADTILTANAGLGLHYTAATALGTAALPETLSVLVRQSGNPNRWLILACGLNSVAWFDSQTGALGTSSGAAYLDHRMTDAGSGYWLAELDSLHTAGNQEQIGISNADGVSTWNAVGNESIIVRLLPSFGAAGPTIWTQRRVSDWADVRGLPRSLAQTTAANRMGYYVDATAPAIWGRANTFLQNNTLATLAAGVDTPVWVAGSYDNAPAASAGWLWSFRDGPGTGQHQAQINAGGSGYLSQRTTAVDIRNLTSGPLSTQASFVDSFDGVDRYILFAAQPETSLNEAIGNIALSTGSVAARVGSGALLSARLRELLFGYTPLSAVNRSLLHSYLSAVNHFP